MCEGSAVSSPVRYAGLNSSLRILLSNPGRNWKCCGAFELQPQKDCCLRYLYPKCTSEKPVELKPNFGSSYFPGLLGFCQIVLRKCLQLVCMEPPADNHEEFSAYFMSEPHWPPKTRSFPHLPHFNTLIQEAFLDHTSQITHILNRARGESSAPVAKTLIQDGKEPHSNISFTRVS